MAYRVQAHFEECRTLEIQEADDLISATVQFNAIAGLPGIEGAALYNEAGERLSFKGQGPALVFEKDDPMAAARAGKAAKKEAAAAAAEQKPG